jgi:two-component system chemotaxis response regulator CheY
MTEPQPQRTVLVIEDSQVIQRLIEVCLRPAGFDVALRSDGPTGIAAANEIDPVVIVLDVGLPGMDGWEVLSHLRSDPRTAITKVLVLTAHAQDQTRERAEVSGASAFLTKPFRPDELRRIVGELAGPALEVVAYRPISG